MKAICSFLAGLALVSTILTVVVADEKKVDTGKLIGKWKFSKGDDELFPDDYVLEFTKDGKVIASAGANFSGEWATYKIDKEKLILDRNDQKITFTVKSITNENMALHCEKGWKDSGGEVKGKGALRNSRALRKNDKYWH